MSFNLQLHRPVRPVSLLFNFYRAKRSKARYCHGKLSVCLSVRLSVNNVRGFFESNFMDT